MEKIRLKCRTCFQEFPIPIDEYVKATKNAANGVRDLQYAHVYIDESGAEHCVDCGEITRRQESLDELTGNLSGTTTSPASQTREPVHAYS